MSSGRIRADDDVILIGWWMAVTLTDMPKLEGGICLKDGYLYAGVGYYMFRLASLEVLPWIIYVY